jgi:hypothetical protein
MRSIQSTFIVAIWITLASPETTYANQFDAVAASCVPQEDAIKFRRYSISSGRVQHNGSNVDLITMYCPVPIVITAPTHIRLLYSDNDTSSSTYVSATYIKVAKATGLSTAIHTVSSEDNGKGEDGVVRVLDQTFSDSYSSTNYVYYIEVNIDRGTTLNTARFYGVSLN